YQSKAPAEVNQSKAPAEVNQSKAPAEVNQSKAPAEVNQSKAPAEVNQSKAPAEVNQGKAPDPPRSHSGDCLPVPGLAVPTFSGPSISETPADRKVEVRDIVRLDPSGVGFVISRESGTAAELDERQFQANQDTGWKMVDGFKSAISGQQKVEGKMQGAGTETSTTGTSAEIRKK
ncbi:hypothetical protein ACFWI3_41640, partial [Streptomyces sp. NPDC127066]